MSWFRKRKSAAESARAGADSEAPDAVPVEEAHLSPALAEVFGEIAPESPLHVLDLGAAVGENLTFLSQRFRCRLQVADLFRSALAAGQPLIDPELDAKRLFRDLLPVADEDRGSVDLVLAWDLLDYMGRDQVAALIERLAKLCRPGGLIYALVHIGKQVPREPHTYVLRGDGELLYRGAAEPSRPGSRYKPAEVDALTPGFGVDRTYLLRHGVQEYLLERAEETVVESAPRSVAATR